MDRRSGRVRLRHGRPGAATDELLSVGANNRCASNLREDLITAGCTREALHAPKSDPLRAHMKFHNLKDTCGTHRAVRRDLPQDIQWRLAHSDSKTTENVWTSSNDERSGRTTATSTRKAASTA